MSATLSHWLDYISRTHPAEIDLGLERVRQVYAAMNIKPKARQIVVVAGTNGKGSTIAMIEAGLLASGKTVGTYTSPHIQQYNERVRVNGAMVSDQQLVDAFSEVESARTAVHGKNQEPLPLTYFEFATLAALLILYRLDLDVLLLEIGLGGRLDAVNIVDADLTIITSIGLDHTDWLGDSTELIGREKAGILRTGILALLGEKMPHSVTDHASAIGAPSMSVGQQITRTACGVRLADAIDAEQSEAYAGFPDLRLPENNILLALQALSILIKRLQGSSFDYQVILAGFEHFSVPGRLEKVAGHDVYLDVGHNPHAALYLRDFLQSRKKDGRVIHAVYSSLADKDVKSVVTILSSVVDCWYIAPLRESRAMDRKSLESAVGTQVKNMLSFDSIPEALHQSLTAQSLSARSLSAMTKQEGLTLVFGSFHVVEAAKAYFESL